MSRVDLVPPVGAQACIPRVGRFVYTEDDIQAMRGTGPGKARWPLDSRGPHTNLHHGLFDK